MLHKMSIQTRKVAAHTPPPLSSYFLVISLFLLVVSFFNNWGNIHRNSSSLDWSEKLEFGVDSEIRLGYNKLQHWVPYPMFFLIQPLFSEFVLTVRLLAKLLPLIN